MSTVYAQLPLPTYRPMESALTLNHELTQPAEPCVIDPALLALGTPTSITNSTEIQTTSPLTPVLITATSASKTTPALTATVDTATAFAPTLGPLVPTPVAASTLDAPLVTTPVAGVNSATAVTPAATAQPHNSPPAALNPFDPRCVIKPGDKDPLYLAAPQTHAQRNPDMVIQDQRQRAKVSTASRAAAAIQATLNKAKAARLYADVAKIISEQEEKIKAVALDHSRKPCDIAKMVNSSANYVSERSAFLGNALVHKKGLELNAGTFDL